MKKLFITIAFVAAGFLASAQGLFLGGNIGFASQSGSQKIENGGTTITQDAPKTFDFTFAPTVGFMFNENMGVGLDIMFGFGKVTQKNYAFDPVMTQTIKTTTFGLAPYFRYVFAEIDNFKFYGDARIEWETSTPKATVEQGGTSMTQEGNKTTHFGIGIVPGMAYMLTDNISMNAQLNILSLYYVTDKTVAKNIDGAGTDQTNKTNEFGLGVNGASPITIGFYYNF
jgi:opacity protein-like surface antigen